MSELARESNPAAEPRERLWEGRTGDGRRVGLYASGAWLELVYYEHGPARVVAGGFALNSLYAGQLTVALVEALADRAASR